MPRTCPHCREAKVRDGWDLVVCSLCTTLIIHDEATGIDVSQTQPPFQVDVDDDCDKCGNSPDEPYIYPKNETYFGGTYITLCSICKKKKETLVQ